MVLVVFQACNELLKKVGAEIPVQVQWTDIPQFGDRISMGDENRQWQVIQVNIFESVSSSQKVEAVYLAHVHPVGISLPLKSEWSFYELQSFYPDQVFHIEMEQSGKEIGNEIKVTGEAKAVGDLILGDRWVVDNAEFYAPNTTAPYKSMQIYWCLPVLELVAT